MKREGKTGYDRGRCREREKKIEWVKERGVQRERERESEREKERER